MTSGTNRAKLWKNSCLLEFATGPAHTSSCSRSHHDQSLAVRFHILYDVCPKSRHSRLVRWKKSRRSQNHHQNRHLRHGGFQVSIFHRQNPQRKDKGLEQSRRRIPYRRLNVNGELWVASLSVFSSWLLASMPCTWGGNGMRQS